ncbi:transcriptional regulator [Bacillus cereus]|uniref:helix-turn-helix domain-containing protein n=1 Tax=Bacillus TaxID=1386 RepID=UPI0006A93286|nr:MULTISPECIES: tetratricopeptide repeat protein [Bacillus]AXP00797.1 helix-turn-helix domain-containing protein [Bacillus anthracis]MDA1909119.1 tetratricopeptide repeat protein [Bacillus cereus]MDA2169573.1 tetratricopeptide repeat protein [Bacillus cereus]MDQ4484362.1 tetratricopeptide repeat protein [Bacillus cereus]MEB9454210.1 tetratricopeptide repeat protein [Bacillus anthracis]
MKLGERIRQIRIHREMTQGELVKGICSITYLSRIENGQIKPSQSFLQKVAKKLDIDVNHLIKVNMHSAEETISNIADRYKETKELAENEVSILELHAREMHPTSILLKIFGVLVHYYVRSESIKKAQTIYNHSTNLIPSRPNNQFASDFLYYYIACGNYFYYIQDFLKANEHYVQADKLLTSEETLQRADLYYNMSLVKQRIINSQSVSLAYSKKAYNIYQKLNIPSRITETLITICVQYHLDGNYEESLKYLKRAEEYIKPLNDPNLLAMVEYNYGRVFQGLKEYEKAIHHFNNTLEINESLHQHMDKIYALRSLIEIYLELKEWEQVDKYMSTALQIVETYDISSIQVEIYMYKAQILKTRGDYYSYEKEMQNTIQLGIDKNQYVRTKQLATELGDYYYDIRAYKQSAKYYKTALNCCIDIK